MIILSSVNVTAFGDIQTTSGNLFGDIETNSNGMFGDIQTNNLYPHIFVPDINLSFGPPNTTLFRIGTCGANIQNSSAVPENQTDTYGIYYVCNNGSAKGDVQIRLSNNLNDNWTLYSSNDSISSNLINLTTTWTTIYDNLGVGDCVYIWFKAICNNITEWMGAYEEYQIV